MPPPHRRGIHHPEPVGIIRVRQRHHASAQATPPRLGDAHPHRAPSIHLREPQHRPGGRIQIANQDAALATGERKAPCLRRRAGIGGERDGERQERAMEATGTTGCHTLNRRPSMSATPRAHCHALAQLVVATPRRELVGVGQPEPAAIGKLNGEPQRPRPLADQANDGIQVANHDAPTAGETAGRDVPCLRGWRLRSVGEHEDGMELVAAAHASESGVNGGRMGEIHP